MPFHAMALAPWHLWLRCPLWLKTLVGMLAGIAIGLGWQEQALQLKPLGTLFVNTIRMLMLPFIFCSVITGIATLGNRQPGRTELKAISLYLGSTTLAICIGLWMGWLLEPGTGIVLHHSQPLARHMAPEWEQLLGNLVSTNPLRAMVDGEVVQILICAVALGLAIHASGAQGAPARALFASLTEAMNRLTQMLMRLAPYGVCALMAWLGAQYGLALLLPLLKVIGAVYLGCLLQVLGVYSSMLALLARLNPWHYFRSTLDAQAVAFTSSSSAITRPVSTECAESRLGVSKRIIDTVLPIGATINMDGTALYQGVTTLFVAQAFGIDLQLLDYLTIILIAVLSSIGAAGVPGTGLMTLTLVLTSVGLPLEGVALIAGIDRILDMARTTVNVSGDILVSVLIARGEGELDLAIYHDPHAGDDAPFGQQEE